jgi:hypothetical protein
MGIAADEDLVLAGEALGLLPALFEVHGLAVVGAGHLPVRDAGAALNRVDPAAVLEPLVDDLVAGERRRRREGQCQHGTDDQCEELLHGRFLSSASERFIYYITLILFCKALYGFYSSTYKKTSKDVHRGERCV